MTHDPSFAASYPRRAPSPDCPPPCRILTSAEDRVLARTRWPAWVVAATWAGIGFLAGVGFVLMVAP